MMLGAGAVIRQSLRSRGCNLNNGADEADVEKLTRFIGCRVDPAICELYSSFNGFRKNDVDQRSLMRGWSIAEILNINKNNYRGTLCKFADRFMGAEIYVADFANAESIVFDLDSRDVVAKSLGEFWRNWISGFYDVGNNNSFGEI